MLLHPVQRNRIRNKVQKIELGRETIKINNILGGEGNAHLEGFLGGSLEAAPQ